MIRQKVLLVDENLLKIARGWFVARLSWRSLNEGLSSKNTKILNIQVDSICSEVNLWPESAESPSLGCATNAGAVAPLPQLERTSCLGLGRQLTLEAVARATSSHRGRCLRCGWNGHEQAADHRVRERVVLVGRCCRCRRRRQFDVSLHSSYRRYRRVGIGTRKETSANIADVAGRGTALAVNGACSTRTAVHERVSVDRIKLPAQLVFAQAHGRLARVSWHVQVVEGVCFEFPGRVSVWYEDSFLTHAAPELVRVRTQWTLEEVAGRECEGAQTATMKDALAAIRLYAVVAEAHGISADHARVVLVVSVLEFIVVLVAEGLEVAQELRQATAQHATGQMEHTPAALLAAVDAGVRVAAVPTYLEGREGEC